MSTKKLHGLAPITVASDRRRTTSSSLRRNVVSGWTHRQPPQQVGRGHDTDDPAVNRTSLDDHRGVRLGVDHPSCDGRHGVGRGNRHDRGPGHRTGPQWLGAGRGPQPPQHIGLVQQADTLVAVTTGRCRTPASTIIRSATSSGADGTMPSTSDVMTSRTVESVVESVVDMLTSGGGWRGPGVRDGDPATRSHGHLVILTATCLTSGSGSTGTVTSRMPAT